MDERLLDVFSMWYEVCVEDMKMAVKDLVLREDDACVCVKTAKGYSVRTANGRGVVYGRGKTETEAWRCAMCYIFGWGDPRDEVV